MAVNHKGAYAAAGWHGSNDDDTADSVREDLSSAIGEFVYFIEANVPLPESVTVEGEVVT